MSLSAILKARFLRTPDFLRYPSKDRINIWDVIMLLSFSVMGLLLMETEGWELPRLFIHKLLLDCGAVQADALTVDRLALMVNTSHEIEKAEVQNHVETKLSEEETDCILHPEDDHPGLLPVDESVHVGRVMIFSSTTTVGLGRKACHHHYKASAQSSSISSLY
ncbi:hypothetical protein D5086_032467 [Populus alba]|uniref:Uncharacterized protein n=1 Tax=Populus alba TaxID=43335 RepID=A0ACC4AMD6_POPAL